MDENDEAGEAYACSKTDIEGYDAVIFSNYDKGFVTERAVRDTCLYNENVFHDYNSARGMKLDIPLDLRFLKLRERDLDGNKHLKLTVTCRNEISERGKHYNRANQIIVTQGHKGVLYMGKTYPPASEEKIVMKDTTGVGDTFIAGLAVSIMREKDVDKAIKFAQECSHGVITKRGVATI
jgi:bifunctional ADP-heptose synthase (sugar kinase/adenylyltransferase)